NRHFRLDCFGKSFPATQPVTADISAHIDRHLHEPGFYRFADIETVNVLKNPQENFLGCVLSVVGRSQQLHGERKDTAFVAHDELFESSRVASERALNE